MGTAATTLFTLLNQKVSITTPTVTETSFTEVFERFEDPCVTIYVKYTTGIEGENLMILNAKDVRVITDLMLGGDGTNTEGDLNEMHLSAISEAMNQMIGSSSTSLSEMVGKKVDISPPEAYYKKISELEEEDLGMKFTEKAVMISFKMTVGDLVDSEIMQMMPIDMAQDLLRTMTGSSEEEETKEEIQEETVQTQEEIKRETPKVPIEEVKPQMSAAPVQDTRETIVQMAPKQKVNAQNVEFRTLEESFDSFPFASDIALIKNVPLEISAELGRCVKKISEILEFTEGSVIELETLVGESLDILANGRVIAKGEVVVVDENYGVRISEIVVPEKQ